MQSAHSNKAIKLNKQILKHVGKYFGAPCIADLFLQQNNLNKRNTVKSHFRLKFYKKTLFG